LNKETFLVRFISVLSLLLAASSFAHAEDPQVPRKAPEFVLEFPDGSTKLLSSFRGKVVTLLLVHTTCPHCQHACQVFSKLYTEYGSKGYQPIAVAWNEMAKMYVADFVKINSVNFPVAYSDRDKVLEYLNFSPMLRTVVPQILWIDKKGMIRSQTPAIGDEKLLQETYWRQMIETLTAEPDGKKSARAATHQVAHAGTQ
jgi:peroxiredoxin